MATLYIDNTNYTSELTGADWTFTNGSATVSSAANGTAQTDGVAVNDYIRDNGGSQWYKVTAVSNETSITISPTFQQTTATPVGVNWSDASTDNGTTTGLAFCHLSQYTTDTVRSAGDIGKIRANQTHKHTGSDIGVDEDGTVSAFITLKGCSVADDPWGDSSDADPVIDFGATINQVYQSNGFFWRFQNLEMINSTDEVFMTSSCQGTQWDNLTIHGGADGLYIQSDGGYEIKDSTFYDNTMYNVMSYLAALYVDNCTFNGGTSGTSYGLTTAGGMSVVTNSSFGQTTAHANSDLYVHNSGRILCSGCLFTKASAVVQDLHGRNIGGVL